MNILSICSGAGLLDRPFLDRGAIITNGCEIDPDQRHLYRLFIGQQEPLECDLVDLVAGVRSGKHPSTWQGIIGGPPCQSSSRTRAMRRPKFANLSLLVRELVEIIEPDWFLFENVAPIDLPGSRSIRLDAMHFAKPHQSRPRWFTFSANLQAPEPIYHGTIDELMAYPAVAAKLYGPKRGAILQGYPRFAELSAPCAVLQKGLANGVPRCLGEAWAAKVFERARL